MKIEFDGGPRDGDSIHPTDVPVGIYYMDVDGSPDKHFGQPIPVDQKMQEGVDMYVYELVALSDGRVVYQYLGLNGDLSD
jgi:hypothetical protein